MGKIRTIYLGLGSNIGDREKNLSRARQGIIANFGPLLEVSSIYETAAWGKEDQPAFLNQAVAFRSFKSPREILDRMLILEKKMGRERNEHWGPRLIDIDLLFCGDLLVNEPGLVVPHPAINERKFVLAPLAEIAADFIHPIVQEKIITLLAQCTDQQKVNQLAL